MREQSQAFADLTAREQTLAWLYAFISDAEVARRTYLPGLMLLADAYRTEAERLGNLDEFDDAEASTKAADSVDEYISKLNFEVDESNATLLLESGRTRCSVCAAVRLDCCCKTCAAMYCEYQLIDGQPFRVVGDECMCEEEEA